MQGATSRRTHAEMLRIFRKHQDHAGSYRRDIGDAVPYGLKFGHF